MERPADITQPDPRYVAMQQGFCPYTRQRCEQLETLRFNRTVAVNSFRTGFGSGSFDMMTQGQREAFEKHQQEEDRHSKLTQKVIEENCVGACALAEVNITDYLRRTTDEQT